MGGAKSELKLATRWGPEGPPACQTFPYLKAPRSGPRRAPGGSVQKKQVVCNTTFDPPFWTGLPKRDTSELSDTPRKRFWR